MLLPTYLTSPHLHLLHTHKQSPKVFLFLLRVCWFYYCNISFPPPPSSSSSLHTLSLKETFGCCCCLGNALAFPSPPLLLPLEGSLPSLLFFPVSTVVRCARYGAVASYIFVRRFSFLVYTFGQTISNCLCLCFRVVFKSFITFCPN